ncbi:MAG: uncharacterized protein JWP87_4728 [Labilithrix sp.]|nr:uncharacterized protein [Labilithrix sp.]
MRPRFALFLLLSSLCALAPLAACGSTESTASRLPLDDDRDAGKAKTDVKQPPAFEDSGPPIDPPGGPGRVYAHSKDTLFLYEPVAGTLKELGKFTFEPATAQADVIDIAVDRTGNVFGTTFNDFFSIDTGTAKCTRIATATTLVDYPNALSFVPAGTADPGKEALVGYATELGTNTAVTYVQIDTVTGEMTTRGNLNASASGPQYKSSGDIISLIQDGNRTYVTVKLIVDGGVAGTDLLAEVDPTDGHVKRIVGDTKQNDIFGLGYWAGKGYGFNFTGKILEIDMSNGASTVLKTLTSDGGTALPWYGAGVTTQAPIR